MFEFSQYFRELNLNEIEFSLVLPLQMCYSGRLISTALNTLIENRFSDSTTKDNEIPQMLRACYLYTLYEELCRNRGEYEGKKLCSQILKVSRNALP